MKLLSYRGRDGLDRVGVVADGVVREVSPERAAGPAGLSPMRRLIAASGSPAGEVPLADGPGVPLDEVRVLPPVPDPTKIVAAPVNYVDHQAEMSQSVHVGSLGVFLKAPSSLIGAGDVVRLPYTDRRFDQEGELAVVIGRTARGVPAADALSHVFGYTCLLDITMRGGEDRSTRKSFDTFTPMGPWLVTPDEVGPLETLRLTCSVNGTLRQDADVRDLIWDVPALIEYVSSVMTLHPGDVISTGTPAGVGAINDGDSVTAAVTRVGELTVGVSAASAVTCPTLGAGAGPVPPAELTPVRARTAN
ncbi:fumarylacetoacetate hydrolase family protein [Amycolatopsis sp. NPDC050768]|uniref:fumarylacetoacetate hydrolase family protein n=1 Tax=Amycolatopsis sp. NPDC050768 TaxID=3154839 RepID=UPI0033C885DB